MDVNEPKQCQGKDVFERMNYLYQASRLVSKSNKIAASYYGNLMMSCAKKSVLRIDSEIKRTVCKSCQSPLIPGETATVRLVSKPVKAVKWICRLCKTSRRLPTKKGYKLWSDNPESLIEIFDYSPKSHIDTFGELSLSKDVVINLPMEVTEEKIDNSMKTKNS